MSTDEITCELVDEGDLDTRYLAGRLSQEEAEAFEAHFFGCERCWQLVQQGLAVQSTLQVDASLRGDSSRAAVHRTRTSRRWWGLAAAAGIAAVVLGIWPTGEPSDADRPEDVLRGAGTEFSVIPALQSAALAASWPQVPEADVYQVRLYRADGMLLFEREAADTSISIPRDSIASAPEGGEMFWQVHALDRLRNSIARSDLTAAVLPDP